MRFLLFSGSLVEIVIRLIDSGIGCAVEKSIMGDLPGYPVGVEELTRWTMVVLQGRGLRVV